MAEAACEAGSSDFFFFCAGNTKGMANRKAISTFFIGSGLMMKVQRRNYISMYILVSGQNSVTEGH